MKLDGFDGGFDGDFCLPLIARVMSAINAFVCAWLWCGFQGIEIRSGTDASSAACTASAEPQISFKNISADVQDQSGATYHLTGYGFVVTVTPVANLILQDVAEKSGAMLVRGPNRPH